ncbi:MAG: NAD-binding protein, partial [Gemmatimonas sp.]|nr:NAD-binding protein [Gemmatimonas sp.]
YRCHLPVPPNGDASEQVISALVDVPDPRARLIIELSTIGPRAAERCGELADAAGWRYVDAPVSGGVRGAVTGELSVMVAGRAADVAASMPVLQHIASKPFVMGERPGLGQVMKLANNAIALAVLPITSEALTFGAAYGLGIEEMIDVINASSGRTQRSEGMFPTSIIPRTFDHGAHGETTRKDVSLYVEEARRVESPIDIGEVVKQIYESFVETHPATDYSYLHEFVMNLRKP